MNEANSQQTWRFQIQIFYLLHYFNRLQQKNTIRHKSKIKQH